MANRRSRGGLFVRLANCRNPKSKSGCARSARISCAGSWTKSIPGASMWTKQTSTTPTCSAPLSKSCATSETRNRLMRSARHARNPERMSCACSAFRWSRKCTGGSPAAWIASSSRTLRLKVHGRNPRMPFQKIPGLDVEYGLISFDQSGQERGDDPEGGVFTQRVLDRIKADKPTDLFLFSHGWKGDEPAAVDQYDRWIGAMAKQRADR